MFSFKQLEALYWIGTLGGFSQAARRLNTTQSAISKRIQELEETFDTPLFDRELRQARLNEKGEEMMMIARRLLEQRDDAVEQFSKPEVIERRLRIGVTELTAMTWLPKLVQSINQHYPRVVIEPEVDDSTHLMEKLLNDEMDTIIVPDAFADHGTMAMPLASVKNVWVAKPGLVTDHKRPLRIHELSPYTILTQGSKSGTGIIYDRWIRSHSQFPNRSMSCTSMVALVGLTAAGMGISYLPYLPFSSLIDNGVLEIVETTPKLPDVTYVALYRAERKSSFISSVLRLVQECCDFSNAFQGQLTTQKVRS
ncbi:LysR family transcriptional regulator [Pandoraea iniqua]|uniref:LysR family transcriptional regulator n=1 Tax=Pandoraea iniqua TaxID=2508288 RepID=UPI00123FADCB|nr:LysR family transcriptional regulator [Pandoraea iniqua]VVE17901.1 LysR family transcriptional regulator [Pandoraea iniqua]